MSKLKVWTASNNRWMRRAASLSLVVPTRKGLFLKAVMDIAGLLLLDQDDLVQKGYGWLLKVTSQTYQRHVFDFVISRKTIMPRTALRYAIEKMPKELKAMAMAKI